MCNSSEKNPIPETSSIDRMQTSWDSTHIWDLIKQEIMYSATYGCTLIHPFVHTTYIDMGLNDYKYSFIWHFQLYVKTIMNIEMDRVNMMVARSQSSVI